MEQVKKVLENIENVSKEVIPFKDTGDFHHNSPYEYSLPILKNGILTNAQQSKHGIIRPTHVEIYGYKLPIDTTNGDDKVSLARMIDEEYPGYGSDFMWDAYSPNLVDFIVDEQRQRDSFFGHCNENYYNEYLVPGGVSRKYIKGLDVRFHNMLLLGDSHVHYPMNEEIFLANYNHLIDMARYVAETGLPISLREVVDNERAYILQPDKVASLEKVKTR